jgi:hypothetical protein
MSGRQGDLQRTEPRESGGYKVYLTSTDREDYSQRILLVSFSQNARRLSNVGKEIFGLVNGSKQEPETVCAFCSERKAQKCADNLISLGLH